MEQSYLIPVYIAYGVVAVGLTIWLARALYRNGAVFLTDVFEDKPEMAKAVNNLLVIGFYMLNLGYACFLLKTNAADTEVEAIEVLATKLGVLLLSLGAIHFANVFVFYRIQRRHHAATMPPPVHPQVRKVAADAGPWQPV